MALMLLLECKWGRLMHTGEEITTLVEMCLPLSTLIWSSHVLWEGSSHDGSILADSLERLDGFKLPYLANAGYACRPRIPHPLCQQGTNLNDFSARFYPKHDKKLFNLRQSRLRVTIERPFSALKNKFKILDRKPFHPFPTQGKQVLTCCTLHN
jgi:hypothetical protein